MKKEWISNVALRSLGMLLLVAAFLKGRELLTTPVANVDIWSYRPFLVLQVESELALAIWLLSGLLKRVAWFVTIACFGAFCCVTLYKGLVLVATPPYGHGPVAADSPCLLGRLAETKEWFVTTPAVALMTQGVVTSAWEEKAPVFDTVLECVAVSMQ